MTSKQIAAVATLSGIAITTVGAVLICVPLALIVFGLALTAYGVLGMDVGE